MRFVSGFRVRRNFMHMKRDQVIYKCPFCTAELIIPVGYETSAGLYMVAPSINLGMGESPFHFSQATLKRELAYTKRLCRDIWPPSD